MTDTRIQLSARYSPSDIPAGMQHRAQDGTVTTRTTSVHASPTHRVLVEYAIQQGAPAAQGTLHLANHVAHQAGHPAAYPAVHPAAHPAVHPAAHSPQGNRPAAHVRTSTRRQQRPAFSYSWARSEDEVREAQRLRYQVFGEEMGAVLSGPPGLDVDEFDARCDHLLVRDNDSLKVVGTYRLLPPSAAPRLSDLYASREFDLRRLALFRSRMVEVGRACVAADYRHGTVMMTLWSGLAAYMRRWRFDTMLGCCSVSMADGGHFAANVHQHLMGTATVAAEYRVFPHAPLPVEHLQDGAKVTAPPLLKAYLRLGAKVGGAPAWDADFNTADFLTLLRLDDLDGRYAQRFFG